MPYQQAEKVFLKEMKGFLFYSKFIWPLHRKLAQSVLTPRCKNCIISAKLSTLNAQGLCKICASTNDLNSIDDHKKQDQNTILHSQLDQLFKTYSKKGTGRFDAAILFSGGKDSSFLVYHLSKTYPELRTLLLTIDNTFMSPFAMKNIEFMVKKFDIEHVSIRPSSKTINKMFRYAFLNLNQKGCSGTVDQFDGDLLHDLGRNFAHQNNIPLVVSGCSRTQVEQIIGINHFEANQESEIKPRHQVAGITLNTIFNEEEMKLWWQGGHKDQAPRMIYPFYVYNFEEQYILDKVVELGIMPPFSNSPLLTNNQLVPLMAIVDMIQFGYSSFENEFSKNVRLGKADRLFWRNIFELSEYSAKTGRFISQTVDQSLHRLNLQRKDLGIPS